MDREQEIELQHFKQKVQDIIHLYLNKYSDNGIKQANSKRDIYSFWFSIVSIILPILFSILVVILPCPTILDSFYSMFYICYPYIFIVVFIILIVILSVKKNHYSQVFEFIRGYNDKEKINETEAGKTIKTLKRSMQNYTNLTGTLCQQISSGNKSLVNLCNWLCVYILDRISSSDEDGFSVSLYEKDGDNIWMPAHISKVNGASPPVLYGKKKDDTTISDDKISDFYFCHCICDKKNILNIIPNKKRIRVEFKFRSKEKRKQNKFNQYANLLVKINDNCNVLIEIIAHNSSIIAPEDELLKYCSEILPPYGVIIPMIWSIAI